MNPEQIEIDGLVINIVRKPIKHMYLRVRADDARIMVSAPVKMPLTVIQQFLHTKKGWLHSRSLNQRQNTAKAHDHSNTLFYLGKHYVVNPSDSKKLVLVNQQFFGRLPLTPVAVNQWHKYALKEVITPLLQQWQNTIGVEVKLWNIRSMKSRWGSCNTHTQRILLNLNLIKYPLECIEYVLVHELVHLLEASHNRRFYQLMQQYLPDWKNRHQRLHQFPVDSAVENTLESL